MSTVLDFDSAERRVVETALKERYGHPDALELADSELRLDPGTPVLTARPTFYWHERGCHFLVFKAAPNAFRCQFFYAEDEHFGTGREQYDELAECVTTLLRLQADHEKERSGVKSGMPGRQLDGESPR